MPNNKPTASSFSTVQWNVIYLLTAAAALVAELTVAVQPLILDQVLGIAFEKEGAINADIMVVVEIIAVMCVGGMGLLSDRIGRVPVIVAGFAIVGIGAVLSLFSLYLGLAAGVGALALFYVTRILLSSGADSVQLQLSTLAGDVSDYSNRPRLLSNVIFMMVFGSTVLSAIILQMTMQDSGLMMIMAVPLLIALAGIALTRRSLVDVVEPQSHVEHPLIQVWARVSGDPRMQLAFAAAFYTRADVIIISLFYSLWCLSVSDSVDVSRTYAIAHAAVMIGLMGGAILLTIPIWKTFIERHSRITAIGAGLSMAATGYLSLVLFDNPFNWLVALPLVLIGVGHAGCLVTLKVLTVDASPKSILGTMLGMAYVTGGAGIIMLVQSSGYYFDAVGPRAPFALMGTGKLLITLYAAWLMLNGIDETGDHHMIKHRKVDWKPLVFLTAALPCVWLLGRIMIGGYLSVSSLSETPVGFINRYLGDWAFTFLIISLSLRPLQELTGLKSLAKYRRMIGLYAFFYAVLHVIAYISLEWAFNLDDMAADIYKRPFIILGLLAFLMLIPLAITSNNDQIKKIGGKRWKSLHRMTYAINLAIALHFIFAATHENGEPYIYATAVLGLLGYRFRQWMQKRAIAAPSASVL